MNYRDWNIAISKYLFNEKNAEKEVYLFLTENDIIGIGRKSGVPGNDSIVLNDYFIALLYNAPPSDESLSIPYSPLDRPLELFEEWNNTANQYEDYPYYLAYLVLFILPLTSQINPNYNYNNYYGRVNEYFIENGFINRIHNASITTRNFSRIDKLWEDLQDWSFSIMNTELGYFELHRFNNPRWIYVGKPLSQCIFSSYAISRLPQLYEHFGLCPGDQLHRNKIREILTSQGVAILGLSEGVTRAIQVKENELGDSIIRIVEKHYHDWKGETDLINLVEGTTTRGWTRASLRLCVEADFPNETIIPYFRLYSPAEYPEDLKFGDIFSCSHQSHRLSKPMFISFEEGASIDDEYNKWKAVIPNKSVRILIKGENFHLSGWVEIPQMDSQSQMLLVAQESVSSSVAEWGGIMEDSEFSKVNLLGLPSGYQTFLLRNPTIDHPDIPNLSFKSDKRVLVTGGVKVGVRKYLPHFLPEIFLENGRGNERMYLKSVNSGKEVELVRKNVERPIWLIPNSIEYDEKYIIHIDGGLAQQNLGIEIVTYEGTSKSFNDKLLPIRDRYGFVLNNTTSLENFSIGSKVIRTTEQAKRRFFLRKGQYSYFFQPSLINEPINRKSNTPDSNFLNDILLFCLSTKVVSNVKEYREAFDTIYYKKFSPEDIEKHFAISKIKRWSLNMMDYMGFLDYDYKTQKIVVNPPQLIPIPAQTGRKALLIGGRTPALLEKLWMASEKTGLSFYSKPQDESVDQFILPNTIIISGWDIESNSRVEDMINTAAEQCGIDYDPSEYPQFSLAEFCGNLNDYKERLEPEEGFIDQGWSMKIFNPQSLNFERISEDDLNRSFSLVEYQLNEYTYIHILWKGELAYQVDKSWGRYMVLDKYEKMVVLNERVGQNIDLIAVPVTVPLPRLLEESLTLFSGEAPMRKKIEVGGLTRWYNLYPNIPHVFAHNLFMKIGQATVTVNIRELCGIL